MKITTYVLPALALGAAAILFAPTENVLGYSTIGGSLSAEAQRDVRVYNNFSDAASNDNTTIHSNWPGWDGAELSLWKATAEWGSEVFGDGTGDPLQTVGSGGANFDAYWAGDTTAGGGVNSNIISAITSCSSGVIAYVEAPISNGWRMRFCDGNFNFSDGPDSVSYFQMDIQGIATHEYGHSLGLGHSATGSATMRRPRPCSSMRTTSGSASSSFFSFFFSSGAASFTASSSLRGARGEGSSAASTAA